MMIKLVLVLLLLVSSCWAQCTSHSCEETDSVQTQMRVITQRLEDLTLENNKLKTTIGGLETIIGRLETTNAELHTTNEKLQTAFENLQVNLTRIQLQAASAASSAYFAVAADGTGIYNDDDAIKFHVTFTNMVPAGTTGGWDTTTNKYTCPVDGDYMFVVTLFKADGADSRNDFRANLTRTSLSGVDTTITYIRNHKESSINSLILFSSTMHAIVPCVAGETVWVKALCSECELYDDSRHHTTFMGFKL